MRDTRRWEHDRRFEDELAHEAWVRFTLRPALRRIRRTLGYLALMVLMAWLVGRVLNVAADRTERLPGQGAYSPAALAEMK